MNIEEDKLTKLMLKAYEEGWFGSKDCAEEAVGKIILDYKNENPELKKAVKKKTTRKKKIPRTSASASLYEHNSLQREMDFGESGVDRAVRQRREGIRQAVNGGVSMPRGSQPSRTGVGDAWFNAQPLTSNRSVISGAYVSGIRESGQPIRPPAPAHPNPGSDASMRAIMNETEDALGIPAVDRAARVESYTQILARTLGVDESEIMTDGNDPS